MLSTRQILFLIVAIFFFATCYAQRERVDCLQKILPTCKDSGRIDCLNELSKAFMLRDGNGYSPFGLTVVQTDSARLYARQALNEAEKASYMTGVSRASF